MDLKQKLGLNIKRYRQLKKFSQEEFAEKLEISQQTLSRIERGINFLTAETLAKIPNVLGVDIHELFTFDDNNTTMSMLTEIENYLDILKSNPKKLVYVHKMIKEIALL